MKKILYLFFAIIGLVWVALSKPIHNQMPQKLGDLAYDKGQTNEHIVMLYENNTLVPYLVLTSDYNGKQGCTLLLRQEVLPETCPYDDVGNAYYSDCTIDKYLNSDFLERFSQLAQEKILSVDIMIAPSYLLSDAVESIPRQVFLLSCTEIGLEISLTYREGNKLTYFYNAEQRIAQLAGKPTSWCLRSAYIADRGLVWGISPDGTAGGGGVQWEKNIRPAFCMDSETTLYLEISADGKEQYCISD